MLFESNLSALALLLAALAAGIGLGFLLRGRSGAALRARAEKLESELVSTREEFDAHRDDVARHFQQTSELFRDVTEQYSRLYTHLAAGARSFSTEGVPALGGLETPLLAEAPAAAEDAGIADAAPPVAEPAEPDASASAAEPAGAEASEGAEPTTAAEEAPRAAESHGPRPIVAAPEFEPGRARGDLPPPPPA